MTIKRERGVRNPETWTPADTTRLMNALWDIAEIYGFLPENTELGVLQRATVIMRDKRLDKREKFLDTFYRNDPKLREQVDADMAKMNLRAGADKTPCCCVCGQYMPWRRDLFAWRRRGKEEAE